MNPYKTMLLPLATNELLLFEAFSVNDQVLYFAMAT
jgi:hypothetical protein